MEYKKPEIADFGDIVELTAAGAIGATEDGVGKSVIAGVGDVASVSLNVLP